MNSVNQVDAFVIVLAVAVGVHAMEYDVFGSGPGASAIDKFFQADAFPLADGTPAFDAIVARDLGARRHGFKLGERKEERLLHQSGYFQTPIDKLLCSIFDILVGNGWRVAVGAKSGRNILLGEFL